MSNDASGIEIDKLLEWLDDQIVESKESYQRDTNKRHTAISLGKVRAYKHVRTHVLKQAEKAEEGEVNAE